MAIVSLAVIAACFAVGGVLFFLIRREIRVARVDINDQVARVRAQLTEVGRLAGAAAVASSSAKPRSLAVRMGSEVVELDADIVARIDALTEDVHARRIEAPTLERLIQAGFAKVEEEAPDSGERGVSDSEEEEEEADDDSSEEITPTSPLPPTRLHPSDPKPKK